MLLPATSKLRFRRWCAQMLLRERPAVLRYAMAVATVGIALSLAFLLPWGADPSHFTLFFLAVMLSAWYGGYGAGFIATIFSAFSLDYFFITPVHAIDLDWRAFLRLAVFLIVAAATSYLTASRKRAEEALRKAHAELEQRVRERTLELAETNDTLRAEIAERKRAEKELLRLQLEMGRVERFATLGRMAATIAHDLGTPLNSVLGYAQLLAQEALSERAHRRLTIIETQIHRMIEIIKSYLAYTRGTPPREKIKINEIIRDTLLLVQPVFQQRSLRVTTLLAESLPDIYGDCNSIQRVLINLLNNAVDACAVEGSIKINTLEGMSKDCAAKGVVIEIADTGGGIAPEILPKVFDLFVTTKAPGKGTGLGLVICQEIVQGHGGTISVASQVGKGTTVTVFLPGNPSPVSALTAEERDERPHIES
jgi:signal transduction histidine kinase